MFLNQLSEKEKESFASLTIHAAKANGVIEQEENIMMQEYCNEMNILYVDIDDATAMDEIVGVFVNSSERVKKIVLLELLGLMYADGTYDNEEKTFVDNFAVKIGFNVETITKINEVLIEYLDVTKKILKILE